MPKAIKYENTEIAPDKSASEIVGMIARNGGEATTIEWDGFGTPAAVRFRIRDPQLGPITVYMPARTEAVLKILLTANPFSYRKASSLQDHTERLRKQAARVVWRHLRDLIEQQLLLVKIGQSSLTDAFMAGVEFTGMDGVRRTVGELVRSVENRKQLNP